MNGNSKFRRENEMYIFISNPKELVNVRTHYYQSTPRLPVRTLYKMPLTLSMMYFFLHPRNVDIIKYNKLRGHTFITNVMIPLPPTPSVKFNNRAIV